MALSAIVVASRVSTKSQVTVTMWSLATLPRVVRVRARIAVNCDCGGGLDLTDSNVLIVPQIENVNINIFQHFIFMSKYLTLRRQLGSSLQSKKNPKCASLFKFVFLLIKFSNS